MFWVEVEESMRLRIVDHSTTAEQAAPVRRPLAALRAVVLLAGEVRTNAIRKQTNRTALCMPVSTDRTVLDCWREQLVKMANALGIANLPARVLVNRKSGLTPRVERFGPVELSIEYDPSSFRGTAGLLSDIARADHDDDHLLVASAGQILFNPLADLAGQMYDTGGDFTLGVHRCGAPSGLMMFRCGFMRSVSSVGFCDLNEQALPELAKTHDVRVTRLASPTVGMPVRTLSSYINALRAYHSADGNGPIEVSDPYQERWRSTFGIVEPEAKVGSDVVVHDSVVLNGATVQSGAVLVRSVVCPGAVVARNERVVDQVVSPSGMKQPA